MKHCQNCNRDYSDKYFRKHCRSNNRSKKRLELNINTKQKNILVNEVDNTLNFIVDKHKRKLLSFLFVCKLNIKKIIGYPKRVFLKYYDKDVKINVEFKFYSNREDMSFNYYISQPKTMLETLMIKNSDLSAYLLNTDYQDSDELLRLEEKVLVNGFEVEKQWLGYRCKNLFLNYRDLFICFFILDKIKFALFSSSICCNNFVLDSSKDFSS